MHCRLRPQGRGLPCPLRSCKCQQRRPALPELVLTSSHQVPSPDEGNLEALHKCVGECDQGDGSESQTIAYSNCAQKCITEHCKRALPL